MSTDMLEDSLYDQEMVAAKARSDTMLCPDCHTVNPATRKFCINCGTALWEPCFRCGVLCPADGNFCGSCGADLRATAAMEVRRFESQMATAEQLRANMEF
ncbi:MAG: zinc ribbon domain-containing protein, partial [Patescibacteria group bacterium]|nr:zinc ribbon domain-containing protein [Patescibacteria group bacterium]